MIGLLILAVLAVECPGTTYTVTVTYHQEMAVAGAPAPRVRQEAAAFCSEAEAHAYRDLVSERGWIDAKPGRREFDLKSIFISEETTLGAEGGVR